MNNAYWLFVVMVIFTVSSPGPGVLMTLDNAIASGWRASMFGVIGLAIGAAIMAGITSAGIGLIVRSSQTLFLLLKYCGVSYLFFLAYKTWKRVPRAINVSEDESANTLDRANAHRNRLIRGALLQTSNPKSLLFFLSVLPQVAESNANTTRQPMQLVFSIATYCIVLIFIHGIYAGLAVKARVWLSRPSTTRLFSRLSAIVFFSFGVAMLSLKL